MNGLEGRRRLRSVAVVLVKAIVLEAVDIRVAQKSRPSHHQIHILCKSQVSMEYYYTLYYMYDPEQLQFSVLTWNEPWENNSNCREAGGRGRRRQLESSYLHWSNVLTKFLEILYYTIWNTCFKSNLKTSSVWWWKFCAFLFWYIVRGIFLAMCTAFCCQ